MVPDLNEVRRELPAVQNAAYLNTGSYGPLSRSAASAIEEANNQQLNSGRLSLSVGEANQSTASDPSHDRRYEHRHLGRSVPARR